MNVSVVFTCRGRQGLTELCLRRFRELMPQPYELIIAYDGDDVFYEKMLADVGNPHLIINGCEGGRFEILNDAICCAKGPLYMHLESDFYWNDFTCILSAVKTVSEYDVDFVRMELLPFTMNQFSRVEQIGGHDVCWMRESTPYRWNLNPHIRNFKFPGNKLLKTSGFSKQPEQHHADGYKGVSCCMSGDNFRHLGIYDEGGHYKEYYSERFFNQRGKRETDKEEMLQEFDRLTDNPLYQKLFNDYLSSQITI